MNKNQELLQSFTAYCQAHPEQRFWQALRNWCGWPFISVSTSQMDEGVDTFYWEDQVTPDKIPWTKKA